MRNIKILFIFILLFNILIGTEALQASSISSESGSHRDAITKYEELFDWVVESFSSNDAGFQYIVDQKGVADYTNFTNRLRNEIKRAKDDDACVAIVREWLGYFRKGHIEFGLKSKPVYKAKEIKKNTSIKDSLYAERLSDKTFYIRIPSFNYSEKEDIENLIEANDLSIQESPNLIIDIRNGIGGSDANFRSLIKYLYTNPIRSYPIKLKVSKFNAEAFDGYAKQMGGKQAKSIAEQISSSSEEFIVPHGSDSVSLIYRDTILRYPREIAILINGINVSADEQFLLYAKQSMKVKLFGETTLGAIDVSNLNVIFSEDNKFYLVYAMSISSRLPNFKVDDIGIQPDYFIDKYIPANEWINYVQQIMEGYIY